MPLVNKIVPHSLLPHPSMKQTLFLPLLLPFFFRMQFQHLQICALPFGALNIKKYFTSLERLRNSKRLIEEQQTIIINTDSQLYAA